MFLQEIGMQRSLETPPVIIRDGHIAFFTENPAALNDVSHAVEGGANVGDTVQHFDYKTKPYHDGNRREGEPVVYNVILTTEAIQAIEERRSGPTKVGR